VPVFIVIGFMIILRKKINQQMVVSVQNAIPKIVTSLILVTFSYAICGLLVDLAFVGNSLVKDAFELVFKKSLEDNSDFSWEQNFIPGNVMGGVANVNNLGKALDFIIQLLKGAAGFIAKGDISGLFRTIIAVTVVGTVFKIFFNLLSRYVMIILYSIFSPFAIIISAIPGYEGYASKFWKTFLSAVLNFPLTLLLMNLAIAIAAAGKKAEELGAKAATFKFTEIPPFTVDWAIKKADEEVIATLAGFIALGVLMAASKLPETIDEALGTRSATGASLGTETSGFLRKIPVLGWFVG